MTYCLAIKLNKGIVFASDSRTNAGVDHVSSYSKMHAFDAAGDRMFVLLTAGNLATTQTVVKHVQRHLEDAGAERSLNTVDDMLDAAHYIGEISRKIQTRHGNAAKQETVNLEATFILGGQIAGKPHEIYLIYPEGNYISDSPATPYLQIGETKYGKPILDRIITPETSLNDAARCALVSLDSTMRSNVSVGPPLELAIYRTDSLALDRHLSLDLDSPLLTALRQSWGEGLKRAFDLLPRFEWE